MTIKMIIHQFYKPFLLLYSQTAGLFILMSIKKKHFNYKHTKKKALAIGWDRFWYALKKCTKTTRGCGTLEVA